MTKKKTKAQPTRYTELGSQHYREGKPINSFPGTLELDRSSYEHGWQSEKKLAELPRKGPKKAPRKTFGFSLPILKYNCDHTGYEFCEHCVPRAVDRSDYHQRLMQLSEADQAIVVGKRRIEIEPPKAPPRVTRIGSGIMVRERKAPDPPRHAKTCDCHPVLRLPMRTLACLHSRNVVCEHCVQGISNRVMYATALTLNPRVLRLDAWRVSLDSNQRNDAGMQALKSTMAELQRQVMLHESYVCDGCVHCKEDSRA
jgi:hypothetical protein